MEVSAPSKTEENSQNVRARTSQENWPPNIAGRKVGRIGPGCRACTRPVRLFPVYHT